MADDLLSPPKAARHLCLPTKELYHLVDERRSAP